MKVSLNLSMRRKVNKNSKNTKSTSTQKQQRTRANEQAPTGDNSSIQMEPYSPTKILPIQEEQNLEEPPKTTQLQMETPKSPAISLIYKTPPSSPQPDTILDLDDDDIRALNEIQ